MAIEDRGPQIAAVGILFLTLPWIAVSLRCYVRTCIMKSFGSDDWLSVASLMTFTVYCALVLVGVKYGTGRHLADLPEKDIPIAVKWWWCNEILYVTTCALIKASIAIFLGRICVKRYQLITIWVVITVVVVFSIYLILLIIFQCHPVSYFWTQFAGEPGSCLPSVYIADSTYTHGAVNIWSDFTLCTLPIFLIWNLNMNPRTKVSVALILSLGALGSIATIVRIPFIYQLAQTSDFLYANTDVAIWSTVEPGLGITAASMACLRPLFHKFLSDSRPRGSFQQRSFSTWRYTSRIGYFRSRNNNEVDELALYRDLSKKIQVTTVIESSTSGQNGDIESQPSSNLQRSGD